MKHNEKGLTLIELLATMTILSIVVVSVIYVYSNFHHTARQQKQSADAVNVARTVLEELKANLPGNDPTLQLFDQSIDLTALRNLNDSALPQTVQYPDVHSNKYTITIDAFPFSKQIAFTNEALQDTTLQLGDYFHIIHIQIIDATSHSEIYHLQSYVEYN